MNQYIDEQSHFKVHWSTAKCRSALLSWQKVNKSAPVSVLALGEEWHMFVSVGWPWQTITKWTVWMHLDRTIMWHNGEINTFVVRVGLSNNTSIVPWAQLPPPTHAYAVITWISIDSDWVLPSQAWASVCCAHMWSSTRNDPVKTDQSTICSQSRKIPKPSLVMLMAVRRRPPKDSSCHRSWFWNDVPPNRLSRWSQSNLVFLIYCLWRPYSLRLWRLHRWINGQLKEKAPLLHLSPVSPQSPSESRSKPSAQWYCRPGNKDPHSGTFLRDKVEPCAPYARAIQLWGNQTNLATVCFLSFLMHFKSLF